MNPVTNQGGRLFKTAKTHRFSSINNITLEYLKLYPIIDLTGKHTVILQKLL